MPSTRDLVCGMMVDTESAPARSSFQGTTYYFCTVECRDLFDSNPTRYTARVNADSVAGDAAAHDLETREAPFTKKGPIAAPKFGSAGSGGLEFEPGPERHGKQS